MMLFKNYIYINGTLLERLAKQVGIKMSDSVSTTKQTEKKAGLSVNKISLGAQKSETSTNDYQNDKYDLLKVFEEKIDEDETGIVDFDFEEAEHITAGQLISFSAKLMKPGGAEDNLEIVSTIRSNPLISSMLSKQIDQEDEDQKMLLELILKENDSIPVYFTDDGTYIVVSSINKNELEVPLEELDDLYDEEVKVILLVDRKYSEEQDIILMDVLKDVFKLGRDIRRTMAKNEQEKYMIKEKGPAIKGEILAMYN